MTLPQSLTELARLNIGISRHYSTILLDLPAQSITPRSLIIINDFWQRYNNQIVCLVLHNLPPCLLPRAFRQIHYYRQTGRRYQRIAACRSCALATSCPGWDNSLYVPTEQAQPIVLTPTEVVIEITGHCNLDCGYCTQAKNSGGHIAVGTVQQLLTQMVRSHVPAVRFTGGEPLLHPKLSELLSCAKSHNLYTLLNTNATILDGKRLEIMARHVDNMLVSLQGFNDSSDRAMTFSPVPFSQKMRNVQKLRSAIPTLRIGTVITPALLKNWDKYVAIIKTIRPHSWEIFRPMSTPLRGRHSVSRANYHTIAGRLLALNQHGINAKIANALPFCMFPDTSIAASTMLGALSDDGHSRLVWDLRGFFKPSYFIDKDLGPKLSDAWKHPFLDKVRNGAGLPAECLTCLCWSRCRGGSRAQAYKHYRSYHARDPLFDRSSARRQARVFTAP